jgi:uncharacterized protein
MKVLFYLHHPAHFHLFKNVIRDLKSRGHELIILATKKDILEDLLKREKLSFINVLPNGRSENKISIFLSLVKQDLRLLKICLRSKPDLLIGTSTEICHIGRILNIANVFVNEDDIDVIPLVGKIAYPFARHLLLPDICDAKNYSFKKISYPGYHELAYLHPNHFLPQKEVVAKYFNPDEKYFVLRFAKLTAHHDKGARGITTEITHAIIKIFEPKGKVYITSERDLEPQFEKYRMVINPLDIHHIIAFAQIVIGDSQTMSAEAGVLGTPFIRFNDFVGRIGYLNDLELKYQLGFGFKTNQEKEMLAKVNELLKSSNLKELWQQKRQKMLLEKIDTAKFLTWFIEGYPSSAETMQNNPGHQYIVK